MVTNDGRRTDTYYAVQAANAELEPIRDLWADYRWLGAYLVNHAKVDGLKGLNFDLYNGLDPKEKLKLSSCDGLLVGCFQAKQGGGKAYVIVNMMELLGEKTAKCTVTFPKGKAVTVYGGGEEKTYANGGKVALTLSPGDGRFITVG